MKNRKKIPKSTKPFNSAPYFDGIFSRNNVLSNFLSLGHTVKLMVYACLLENRGKDMQQIPFVCLLNTNIIMIILHRNNIQTFSNGDLLRPMFTCAAKDRRNSRALSVLLYIT